MFWLPLSPYSRVTTFSSDAFDTLFFRIKLRFDNDSPASLVLVRKIKNTPVSEAVR